MFNIRIILPVVILTFMLAACDSSVSSMEEAEMDGAAMTTEAMDEAVGAKATNGTMVQRSPVVSFLYSPCLGDFIKLDGEVHIVMRSGASSGNGGYHDIDRRTYRLDGIGLLSGDRYEVRNVVANQENSRLPFGSTTTSMMNFRIIKPGSGMVFKVQSMEHMTVNANGEITVELDTFTGTCSP
jgi:hypothetical protein